MAFRLDQTLAGAFSASTFVDVAFAEHLWNRLDVVQTWTSAADEIKRLTLNRISIRLVDPFAPEYFEERLVIGPADEPGDCDARFSPPWPFETAGYCAQWSPDHSYVPRFNVLPDRLTDGSVALRALLMGALGMRPHAMPGLLNRDRPDRDVSTFERKTLHMIGLRYGVVRWPDLEP
jgi:hypothetical protein